MTGEALLEKNLRKGHFSVEKNGGDDITCFLKKNLNNVKIS